jgi:hypothetical protein
MNQRILTLTDELNQQVSALSGYTEELRNTLPDFDSEIRGYITDMRRDAVHRLTYFHYVIAKAYEYRLLSPHEEPLLLQPIYDRMEAIARTDKLTLTRTDIGALMEAYHSQLKSMTAKILAKFESQPLESEIKRTFVLTDDEIDTINRGQDISINLARRAEFDVAKEGGNRRIVNIEVSNMSCDSESGNVDIFVQHSGYSILTNNTNIYRFEHIGPEF